MRGKNFGNMGIGGLGIGDWGRGRDQDRGSPALHCHPERSEGSRFMLIMSHLLINTGRRGSWRLVVPVGAVASC